MFQGVFDVLLAQKIASNVLFEKCSRFHISNIVTGSPGMIGKLKTYILSGIGAP